VTPGEKTSVTTDKGGLGAQSQGMIEQMASREKFIAANIALMQTEDAKAIELFKGVTLNIIPVKSGSVSLSIEAALQMGKDLNSLSVAQTVISFDEKNIKPTQLPVSLIDPDAAVIKLKDDQIKVIAVCNDAKCSELHVRIQVATEAGTVELALVESLTKSGYTVSGSNLGNKLMTVEAFQKSLAGDDKGKAVDKDKAAGEKADSGKPKDIPVDVVDPAAKGDKDGAKGADGKTDDGKSTVEKDAKATEKKPDTSSADAEKDNQALAAELAKEKAKSATLGNPAAPGVIKTTTDLTAATVQLQKDNAATADALSKENAALAGAAQLQKDNAATADALNKENAAISAAAQLQKDNAATAAAMSQENAEINAANYKATAEAKAAQDAKATQETKSVQDAKANKDAKAELEDQRAAEILMQL
ncbi:MAG: hypothetical protein ACXVA9_02755, partial [Bdellovibrionales bacterium]